MALRLPGWDSKGTVERIHTGLEITEIISLAVAVGLEVAGWPRIGNVGFIALVIAEVLRHTYGRRDKTLSERDNERFREKFKRRDLSAEVYRDLEDELHAYTGMRIDIFAFDGRHEDVLPFAYQLAAVSRRAGIDCKLWAPPMILAPITGASVVLATAKESSPEENDRLGPVAVAFSRALRRCNINSNAVPHGFSKANLMIPPPDPLATFLPWNHNDVASFRIQVVDTKILDNLFGP